jgi:hypothetical protein
MHAGSVVQNHGISMIDYVLVLVCVQKDAIFL